MRGKFIFAILCLLALIVVTSLFAHDTWLVPAKYHCTPGETITIDIATGMSFPASEVPVDEDRVKRFEAIHGEQRIQPESYAVADEALRATLSIPEGDEAKGTWVAVCSLNPRLIELSADDFNEYLLHDGLARIYKLRERESLLENDAVEKYTKHAKSLVQVGGLIDNNPTRPFGQTIEIVPEVNPYSLKQGDSLAVKVHFRGKPLAEAEIAWTYDGKEGFAGSATCGENGAASIPLDQAGAILLRTIHMEHMQEQDFEWESHWASLTFEVPGR